MSAPAAVDLTAATNNPLLQPWSGPFGGVPPFDRARVGHFVPALTTAMAEGLREIDAIAANAAPATFENTIAALEKSGRTLARVSSVLGVFGSTMSTPDFRKVELELAPKLAAFNDQITQNPKLFARIAAVYAQRDTAGLTPEQQRLAWVDYNGVVRAGAKLDGAAKDRL